MTGGLMIETCMYCGKELQKSRKLKDFCSYAHRGAHTVKALDGPEYQSGLSGSKNTKRNKALRTLQKQSRGDFTFHRINSATYQIDRPDKRAAWPGGARQRWIARDGNRASEQLPLGEAKKAAVVLLRERGKTEPRDWIPELNQAAANEVDRLQRKYWPVDLLGGERRGTKAVERELRAAILETEMGFIGDPAANSEPLQGDHYPLTFDADGYPELPACLDCRKPTMTAQAA
jgi:hypothetical protein